MEILSHRRQIAADHSSTNYLFYSPGPLSREARDEVGKLSSHVDVRTHTAAITYHGDFAGLGSERERKFLRHYDVEVRESYDWWSLSIMLEPEKLPDPAEVIEYRAEGGEATLSFGKLGGRIRLMLESCHLDYNAVYGALGEEPAEGLARLAVEMREELYAGRLDALAVMAGYCRDNRVPDARSLSPAARTLAAVLQPV